MLQFFGRPERTLNVRLIEKSLLAISPESDSSFDSFNLAKIQETSAQSIAQISDIMTSGSRTHVLATIPLELSNDVYARLSHLNYKVFQCRSVLHLDLETNKTESDSRKINIIAENSPEHFAAAIQILNSFHPTTREDFEKRYSYWLKNNTQAELYIARIEKKPVAMGVLSWYGSAGLLSSGVVVPSSRGQGIQKILINRRIQRCQQLGLKHLFAPGVPSFSASESSLRSCGFQLICNRTFWKK